MQSIENNSRINGQFLGIKRWMCMRSVDEEQDNCSSLSNNNDQSSSEYNDKIQALCWTDIADGTESGNSFASSSLEIEVLKLPYSRAVEHVFSTLDTGFVDHQQNSLHCCIEASTILRYNRHETS